MKKLLLFFTFVFTVHAASYGQIANFNMENWTTLFGGTNPTGWVSNNVLTSNATVVQDNVTKHAGTYAAQIVTGVLSPNPLSAYMPDTSGFMLTGALNLVTQKIQQGYSYSTRSDTLGVWAKYQPQAGDNGFIYVALTKRNALGTGTRDTVASGTYFFTGNDAAFSFRNIPLDYASFGLPSSTLPDSAMIIVSSSKRVGGKVGSKLWVDDFQWDPTFGVGMQEKHLTSYGLYPSPAQNQLRFNLNLFNGKKSLALYDVAGRVVLETSTFEANPIIDISILPEGMYQSIVTDENGMVGSQRFVIAGK
jgi:hypothetical protein